MHGDAGSATLLRPETMTASAAKWLHRYHQIIKWHEQEERGLCSMMDARVRFAGYHAQLR